MFASSFNWITQPSGWIALLTLTAMEVVLGIDNVVFLSLIGARLPDKQARIARMLGLVLAFVFRITCLTALTALIALTTPVVTVFQQDISWRDVILFAAGLFLIAQATRELHHAVEDHDDMAETKVVSHAFGVVILNIAVMDLVFSFDSILTAIGMANDLAIMIIAVIIALLAMYLAANSVAAFIKKHPTAKVLALSFLVLIGFSLAAEGSHFEIPRGYLYAAMAFSTGVEAINIVARNRRRAAQARRAAEPLPPELEKSG